MSLQSTTIPSFDDAAAQALAERAGEIINAGAVAVMMSIRHRTGLFDTLASLPPSTSGAIAGHAELSERYVREWLAVMTTAGIVSYDPARQTYSLPAEHAACLTRGAPLGNLAAYAQIIPIMGAAQDRILRCFESGEETTYADYPCFHAFMAEDSAQTVVAQLFDLLLPLADGIIARLEAGIDVLDAGCGRGLALMAMAERFPQSRFTGYDLCEDAIEDACRMAAAAGLENVRFEVRVYLMQDIGGSARLENNLQFPMASFLYAVSCTHCTPIFWDRVE